ncbi:20136_t:CDS:2 [Rhizophagus irregularis]|nr:20136_t:CDS:2 [Rhizophagus irregularis]
MSDVAKKRKANTTSPNSHFRCYKFPPFPSSQDDAIGALQ